MHRQVGADAYRDRQVLLDALRALECGAQVPAEVELDGGALGAEQLEAMVGGVVDAGFRIFDDDDAAGDEAPAVRCGVAQDRQHLFDVEVPGMHDLLARAFRAALGRDRIAHRARDEAADVAIARAESSLAVGLAAQQVADDRHGVALHLRKHQRLRAVQPLHDRGDLEVRIGFALQAAQPSRSAHALERGAKIGVERGRGLGLHCSTFIPDCLTK